MYAVSPGWRPFGGKRRRSDHLRPVAKGGGASKFYHAFDDGSPPDAETIRELLRVSRTAVIFGWNYFWDKKRRGMAQADCEIAWTNIKGGSRIFEFRWNGMPQGDMAHKETRIHPTQKPVALYRWLFRNYAKPGDKILDPCLGSGSSRIAAHDAGLDFTGYEIDPEFYRLQDERFEAYAAQENLFLTGGGAREHRRETAGQHQAVR